MITTELDTDRIISLFIKSLRERLGSNLKEAWLFGSRARGDYSSDSDYDILVIADGEEFYIRRIIREEEYDILENEGELVVSTIYNPDTWRLGRNSPLGWNIIKEGIQLV